MHMPQRSSCFAQFRKRQAFPEFRPGTVTLKHDGQNHAPVVSDRLDQLPVVLRMPQIGLGKDDIHRHHSGLPFGDLFQQLGMKFAGQRPSAQCGQSLGINGYNNDVIEHRRVHLPDETVVDQVVQLGKPRLPGCCHRQKQQSCSQNQRYAPILSAPVCHLQRQQDDGYRRYAE